MRSAVGGGITQNHQRLELGQGLQRFLAFHFLWFIQNQNGAVTADDINGLARLKIVQLVVNAAIILSSSVKSLNVDNHDIDARIRRKTLKMLQLPRVVSKKAYFLAVTFGKMLGSNGKRFQHTFTDGNAWNNNNKFAPAIELVHFENGLDVAIRLARASFHFNIKIEPAPGAGHQSRG